MKRLVIVVLTLFSFFTSYDSLFADNFRIGSVNKKYLRLRIRPTVKSEVKETLNKDDRVTVLEKSGKWYKVKTSTNKGWVKSKYISNSYYITSDSSVTTDEESIDNNETRPDFEPVVAIKVTSNPLTSNGGSSITTTKPRTNSNSNSNSNSNTNTNSNSNSNNNSFFDDSSKKNKKLPKMNNTASKNKVQEVSNEIDNFNNNNEDF